MNETTHRDRLLAALRDAEFATAYFVRAAQKGDPAALRRAVNDILESRGALLVQLTKIRARPEAAVPPGSWDSYRVGDLSNEESLPVDYTLTGILLVPPQIGGRVIILRLSRNGVEMPGVYESTAVITFDGWNFTTLNSAYSLEVINEATR